MALSSTEAEYITCSEGAKEAIWIRRLFSELLTIHPPSTPILLYADNQSAVQLVKNNRFHERTKHIDRKYHPVRDTLAQGLITIEHVGTSAKKIPCVLSLPAHPVRRTFQALIT